MDVQVGHLVNLKARARDRESGEIVHPEEVSCMVRSPTGVTTPAETTRDGDWYRAVFTPTAPGAWVATFAGSGQWQTAGQIKIYVAQPQ